MTLRASQFFLLAAFGFFVFQKAAVGRLIPGEIYALSFADLDGRTLATNDGHVTVVVSTTRADVAKAELVGARVPDYCLGNPEYRLITVVNFGRAYGTVARAIASAVIRRRINAKAAQLQRRYDAKGIRKDAHRDVFCVADFDGTMTQQFGLGPSAFRVFVFGRDGKLLRQWADVPSAAGLAAVVK